jgi:hypothetical protein
MNMREILFLAGLMLALVFPMWGFHSIKAAPRIDHRLETMDEAARHLCDHPRSIIPTRHGSPRYTAAVGPWVLFFACDIAEEHPGATPS